MVKERPTIGKTIGKTLHIGSLNVTALRNDGKQALVSEFLSIKIVLLTFLQESHSDGSNEFD